LSPYERVSHYPVWGLSPGYVGSLPPLEGLGIVSHFQTGPRADGTLLSSIGDEERPLQPGRCYEFDGVADYVDVPDVNLPAMVAFTVSLWMNPTHKLAYRVIFEEWASAKGVLAWINNDGTWRLQADTTFGAGSQVTLGEDTHVVVTSTGSVLNLYVNGVLEVTVSDTTKVPPGVNLTFGGGSNGGGGSMEGKMWDGRVYGRVLTADERLYLLTHGDAGTDPTVEDLELQLKMDDRVGLVAYDSSGNGNHGAIQNATLSSFHAEQDVYSYQNQVGYTEGDGSNGAVVGVFIPRDESDIAKDVLGNPLQYNGLAKLIAIPRGNACGTFDGTNDGVKFTSVALDADFEINFSINGDDVTERHILANNAPGGFARIALNVLGYLSVWDDSNTEVRFSGFTFVVDTDYEVKVVRVGTGVTLTVDGVVVDSQTVSGTITLDSVGLSRGQATSWGTFDGQIWGVSIVKAGVTQHSFPFSEGAGSTVHDIANGNHGTITNATLTPFWAGTQDVYAKNFRDGFTLYEHATLDDIRVPYGSDGNPLSITPASGYTKELDHPPSPTHNDFEGVIDYLNVAENGGIPPILSNIYKADGVTKLTVPDAYAPGDLVINPMFIAPGEWTRLFAVGLVPDESIVQYLKGVEYQVSLLGTDWTEAWRDDEMNSFPVVDMTGVTTCAAAWRDNDITAWTVALPASLTNCSYAWYANDLTAWTVALPAGLTDCSFAWNDNNLTSWTVDLPASLTTCRLAWLGNSLTSWTIALPTSLTTCSSAWRDNNLTSWAVDLPAGLTDCSHAWYNNDLTSWTVELPAGLTSCSNAWRFNSLTSWTVELPAGLTDCSTAWSGNNLTSWNTEIPAGVTTCRFAWSDNNLTSWTAGLFDSWSATPATNCFLESWGNNTGLTPTAVENILVSIAASGVEGPASGNEITIDYNGAGLTGATTTAITTLKGYGSPWAIKINGVTQ